MYLSGKETDRLVFYLLYVLLSIFIIRFGLKILDNATVSGFTNKFILSWETSFLQYMTFSGKLPVFKGNNHVGYMERLVFSMKQNDIYPPQSNTDRSYEYLLSQMLAENEEIFLICFSDRMVFYGLSKETFNHIDGLIDGVVDPDDGKFTGKQGRGKDRYIGSLKI